MKRLMQGAWPSSSCCGPTQSRVELVGVAIDKSVGLVVTYLVGPVARDEVTGAAAADRGDHELVGSRLVEATGIERAEAVALDIVVAVIVVAGWNAPVVLNHHALTGPGQDDLLARERRGDEVDVDVLLDLDADAAAKRARLLAMEGNV